MTTNMADKKSKQNKDTKIADEDEDRYVPECIRANRTVRGEKQYKIRWQGFDRTHDTWEKAETYDNDPAFEALVMDYNNGLETPQKKPKKAKNKKETKQTQERKGKAKPEKETEQTQDEASADPPSSYSSDRDSSRSINTSASSSTSSSASTNSTSGSNSEQTQSTANVNLASARNCYSSCSSSGRASDTTSTNSSSSTSSSASGSTSSHISSSAIADSSNSRTSSSCMRRTATPSMASMPTLEERVSELEQTVRQLLGQVQRGQLEVARLKQRINTLARAKIVENGHETQPEKPRSKAQTPQPSQNIDTRKASVPRQEPRQAIGPTDPITQVAITGVPYRDGEDLRAIVSNIAEATGNIELADSDFECIRALDGRRTKGELECTKRTPKIIVQLKVPNLKYKLRCRPRTKLKVGHARVERVTADEKEQPVYINENLTRRQSLLFYKARRARREMGWGFAWTRDGEVLMREREGEEVIRIQTERDLPVPYPEYAHMHPYDRDRDRRRRSRSRPRPRGRGWDRRLPANRRF